MKSLLPAALASVVIFMGSQAQAQSRHDVCAAYARDAMMAFYSSSAVPVSMPARDRGMARRARMARTDAVASQAVNQETDSLQNYYDRCMAR
jgi:hypothetical protein